MATRKGETPSVKVFLSHRYKSPEVNLYFYDLLSERANVQFEVDSGTSATSVTRLERMIRDSDAFVGLYPFPPKADALFGQADLADASRYFRLEIDIALRMHKPMLVFFDQRYEDTLCLPDPMRALTFDIQEVAGRGGSPRIAVFRKAVTDFVAFVGASMALDSVRGATGPHGRVGLLLPDTASGNTGYAADEIVQVRQTAKASQLASLDTCPGTFRVDGQMHRWLASLDWLIAEVGEVAVRSGLAGFVHGTGIPTLRLYKGAASVAAVEDLDSFRGLFGGFEVGYRKDIVFWETTEDLDRELGARIRRLREPARRITTRDEAEAYFRGASLRNEAVFVSYSGQDRELALGIANCLKRRFQKVFDYRDGQSIVAGQPWLKEIFDQLAKSALGVALLSKSYMQSGNCQHELQEMVAKQDMGRMAIIPVKLYDDGLDAPEWMQNVQYLRYREYANPEAVADSIVQSFDVGRARTAASR